MQSGFSEEHITSVFRSHTEYQNMKRVHSFVPLSCHPLLWQPYWTAASVREHCWCLHDWTRPWSMQSSCPFMPVFGEPRRRMHSAARHPDLPSVECKPVSCPTFKSMDPLYFCLMDNSFVCNCQCSPFPTGCMCSFFFFQLPWPLAVKSLESQINETSSHGLQFNLV